MGNKNAKKTKSLPPTPADLSPEGDQVFRLLTEETDRGAALVGAAYIDDILASTLRAFFIDDAKEVDLLVGSEDGGQQPLGTLSARARMAYCLGIIGRKVYVDLGTIRKIRNKFAHKRSNMSFGDAEIGGICDKLRTLDGLGSFSDMKGRNRFIVTVSILTQQLLLRALPLAHAMVAPDFAVHSNVVVPPK